MIKWVFIDGFEDRYVVNDIGEVISLNYNRTGQPEKMTTSEDKDGYLKVGLTINKKIHNVYIHRLIGKYFIPNPENKRQINHKNGVKSDNIISNLEWCTQLENSIHSTRVLGNKPPPPFFKGKRGVYVSISKPINQVDKLTNEIICCYVSVTEASEKTGIDNSHIGKVAKGKAKSAGGFKWEFKNKNNE